MSLLKKLDVMRALARAAMIPILRRSTKRMNWSPESVILVKRMLPM
jgi:hypothetical protein